MEKSVIRLWILLCETRLMLATLGLMRLNRAATCWVCVKNCEGQGGASLKTCRNMAFPSRCYRLVTFVVLVGVVVNVAVVVDASVVVVVAIVVGVFVDVMAALVVVVVVVAGVVVDDVTVVVNVVLATRGGVGCGRDAGRRR